MITCKFCKKSYDDKSKSYRSHLIKNHLKKEFDMNRIKLEEFYLQDRFNISSSILFSFVEEYKNKNNTISAFARKNKISKATMIYYLRLIDIPIYSSKEMCGLDYVLKNKENTCIERYGYKSPFNDEEIRKLGKQAIAKDIIRITKIRVNAIFKKYGVNNVMELDWVRKKSSNSLKLLQSKKTPEQRFNDTENARKACTYVSKLELRVQEVLNNLGITYTANGFLYRYNFDFIFSHKIILEIQGDFWHGNPNLYEAEDILLKHKNSDIPWRAKDIWKKDAYKKKIVELNGWKIYYLWENEINKMTYDDIKIYLLNILEINDVE